VESTQRITPVQATGEAENTQRITADPPTVDRPAADAAAETDDAPTVDTRADAPADADKPAAEAVPAEPKAPTKPTQKTGPKAEPAARR
jgi:hypothetical protein